MNENRPLGVMRAAKDREIAPSMRTDNKGTTVADKTLKRIVACAISRPTASNKLIAQLTGIHRNTVSSALQTEYAIMALIDLSDLVGEAKKGVVVAVGDSIEFVQDSISTGTKHLNGRPKLMSPFLISNAKDCALTILKNTILPDQLVVKNELHSPSSFIELSSSDLLSRYKAIKEKGEGEPESD